MRYLVDVPPSRPANSVAPRARAASDRQLLGHRRPGVVRRAGGYQACSVPQCGQSTEVDTAAVKA